VKGSWGQIYALELHDLLGCSGSDYWPFPRQRGSSKKPLLVDLVHRSMFVGGGAYPCLPCIKSNECFWCLTLVVVDQINLGCRGSNHRGGGRDHGPRRRGLIGTLAARFGVHGWG
jgi:hypothetical protein